VSANFPFYPGSSITLRGNPEFAAAYQKWMETHPPEGGFRLSWGIAMWARLERGDQVGSLMETYMQRAPAANLHNTRNNQSDASFGFTAAVAEALLPCRRNQPVARLAAPMDRRFSPGTARSRSL
jgi:hypothetical protein